MVTLKMLKTVMAVWRFEMMQQKVGEPYRISR